MKNAGLGTALAAALVACAAILLVLIPVAIALFQPVLPLAWMGGVAGTVGQVFNNSGISNAATVSRLLLPTDGLWRADSRLRGHPSRASLFGRSPLATNHPGDLSSRG